MSNENDDTMNNMAESFFSKQFQTQVGRALSIVLTVVILASACKPDSEEMDITEESDFYSQRKMLIEKYSQTDNVFEALAAQVDQ